MRPLSFIFHSYSAYFIAQVHFGGRECHTRIRFAQEHEENNVNFGKIVYENSIMCTIEGKIVIARYAAFGTPSATTAICNSRCHRRFNTEPDDEQTTIMTKTTTTTTMLIIRQTICIVLGMREWNESSIIITPTSYRSNLFWPKIWNIGILLFYRLAVYVCYSNRHNVHTDSILVVET